MDNLFTVFLRQVIVRHYFGQATIADYKIRIIS